MSEKSIFAENDPVNHPGHYCNGGVECIDAIKGSMADSAAFRGAWRIPPRSGASSRAT